MPGSSEGYIERDTKFIMSLPEYLKQSLIDYTSASTEVNRSLRHGRRPIDQYPDMYKKYEIIIDNIDIIFDRLIPTTEPITLYRGINREEYAETDSAFISTSYSLESAVDFSEDCYICVIHVPVGSKILFIENIARVSHEREVLIDRGGTFSGKIVDMTSSPKKIYIAYNPPNSVLLVESLVGRITKDLIEFEIEFGDPYNIINGDYKDITKGTTNISRDLVQDIIDIILKK